MRQCKIPVIFPKRVSGDIGNYDIDTGVGRGTARTGADSYFDAIYCIAKSAWQVWCYAMAQSVATGIHKQNRTAHTGKHGFVTEHQIFQHLQ